MTLTPKRWRENITSHSRIEIESLITPRELVRIVLKKIRNLILLNWINISIQNEKRKRALFHRQSGLENKTKGKLVDQDKTRTRVRARRKSDGPRLVRRTSRNPNPRRGCRLRKIDVQDGNVKHLTRRRVVLLCADFFAV